MLAPLPTLAITLVLAACQNTQPVPQTAAKPAPASAEQEASPADRRAAFLRRFTIKGAGGDHYLESAAAHGANVIRTWAVAKDGSSIELLDRAHDLGLKVLLGIWMPDPKDAEHYRIKGRWQQDYDTKQEEYLELMQSLLDTYDSHPAVFAWGLGNEVEFGPSYLKTVNAMSQLAHKHNPNRITCIVNVHANGIDMVKEYANDVDLYGANSYGAGAMNGTSRKLEEEWGKPYFFSEFAHQGPWSAKSSATGYPMEYSPKAKDLQVQKAVKVLDSRDTFPNLIGGVYFLWGSFSNGTHTWFSGLLQEDPATKDKKSPAHLTPFTDSLQKYWTGTEVSNHAPIISSMTIDGKGGPDIVVQPGGNAQIHVDVADADNDSIQCKYWIFRTNDHTRGRLISGPHIGSTDIELVGPPQPGSYTVLVYAIDPDNKASSHQLPFRVAK